MLIALYAGLMRPGESFPAQFEWYRTLVALGIQPLEVEVQAAVTEALGEAEVDLPALGRFQAVLEQDDALGQRDARILRVRRVEDPRAVGRRDAELQAEEQAVVVLVGEPAGGAVLLQLLDCRNQQVAAVKMPAPARITLLPLLPKSHERPSRGWKLFSSTARGPVIGFSKSGLFPSVS
jgi:hypothetical protein